jgi:tRNA pseudouridine55 synthase
VDGFVYIDKPVGPSSFDMVRRAKRAFRTGKVGHSGTLDPAASGLLILALDGATRLLPYLPSEPKRYEFEVQFGATTDTLDGEGELTRQGAPIPTREALVGTLGGLRGEIDQVPPRHSAVKVNGKKAYELARRDREFELEPRRITVTSLRVLSYDQEVGKARIEVDCSTGTYVRALARDLAVALGTVAYTTSIRRHRIGPVSVEDACAPEVLDTAAPELLVPPRKAFDGCPALVADEAQMRALSFGRDIETRGMDADARTVFVYTPDGELAAVARRVSSDVYHPEKVLLTR